MTKEEMIRIGTLLGLQFEEKTNYKDSLERGIVVFDGCNGQRFLFDSQWPEEEIYEKFGSSLILQGKRMKALEIHRVLSINSD
jgi:hypothetical protein